MPAETVDLAALAPELPQNRELLNYWRQLRGDRPGAPAREAFDPMEVPRLLPNIMLLERSDDSGPRVRLMGTALAERHQHDLTGQPLLPALHETLRRSAAATYEQVLSLPCVDVLLRRILRVSGATPVVEVLHLPWQDRGGTVRFVMTAVWEADAEVALAHHICDSDWQAAGDRRRALL